MLRKPDELVLGDETASDALDRFERAVRRVIDEHRQQTIAVVSGESVIAGQQPGLDAGHVDGLRTRM